MKKKVIILGGGISKERLISLETAKSVYKELKKNKNYKSIIAEPDSNFLEKIKSIRNASKRKKAAQLKNT